MLHRASEDGTDFRLQQARSAGVRLHGTGAFETTFPSKLMAYGLACMIARCVYCGAALT